MAPNGEYKMASPDSALVQETIRASGLGNEERSCRGLSRSDAQEACSVDCEFVPKAASLQARQLEPQGSYHGEQVVGVRENLKLH